MFEVNIDAEWTENMKDKMITFIDLYRKYYKEPIKDIKYKKGYHEDFRMVITFYFENEELTFECVETDDTNWVCLTLEMDTKNKKLFDDKYDFIIKTIKQINKGSI